MMACLLVVCVDVVGIMRSKAAVVDKGRCIILYNVTEVQAI